MKRFLFLCLLCSCLAVLRAQISELSPIQRAMNNYDYETALQLMEEVPPTVSLLYLKGKALKELGRNREALEVFRQLIMADSLNLRAYIEAGECYKAQGKFLPALQCYERVLQLKPEHKYAHIQHITQLLNLQRYQEALGESSQLAEQDSSSVALHLKAQSLEGLYTDPNILIGAYQEIHDRYPDDYVAASKLASLYIRNNYYAHAIQVCETYRLTDTTNLSVNRLAAQAYCLNQNYDTAITRYRTLLAQGDTTFYNCYYAGISYYAKDLYFEAHDLLEAARKYAPEHVDLLYYLGRACSKTSWKEKGIDYMQDAIRLSFPTDSLVARLYAGLADCYKEAGEPQKQIETLMKLYKYSPQKHSLLYRAAYVSYFRLRDFEATEKYLKAYIKTRPEGSRNLPQEVAEDGTVIINENNRYNAAERWLEDLQKRKKVEDFFKGKTKDGVNTPLTTP